MKARKATLKDAKRILKIYFELMLRFEKMDSYDKQSRKYWKEGALAELKKIMRSKDSRFYIIEDKKKIAGFVDLRLLKKSKIFVNYEEGHIESLYIKPEYRKKGYSRLLLDEAEKWFKKRKMKWITVGTHAYDDSANMFWKKQGFRIYNHKYVKKF